MYIMFYPFLNIDWHVILMADHLSNAYHSNLYLILSYEVFDNSWIQELFLSWLFLMPDQIFKPVQSP